VLIIRVATLQLHILDATVSIHEQSLIPSCHPTVLPDPSADLQRVGSLWACFTATKSWITTFNSEELFPIARYPHFSVAIFAQMAHCLVVLFRLSMFEFPGVSWDRQRALKELDLGEVLRSWIKKLGEVPETVSLDKGMSSSSEENTWNHGVGRMSLILEWWEVKVAPRLAAPAQARDQATKEDANTTSLDLSTQQAAETLDLTMADWDYLDDAWMRDIMSGSDEYFRDIFH
jgi:hypothetical protein